MTDEAVEAYRELLVRRRQPRANDLATDKPVAIFYFYKVSQPTKASLLPYLEPTGWSL